MDAVHKVFCYQFTRDYNNLFNRDYNNTTEEREHHKNK